MDGSSPQAVAVTSRADRSWWLALARGLGALGIGAIVLITRETRPSMVNKIAIYWMVGSFLSLRWALLHATKGRISATAAGAVGFAAGALVLLRFALRSSVSLPVLRIVLGTAALLTGLLRVTGTFRDPQAVEGRVPIVRRAPLAVVEIVLGSLLLAQVTSTRPIAIVAGLWGLVLGIALIREAVSLRRRSTEGLARPGPIVNGRSHRIVHEEGVPT